MATGTYRTNKGILNGLQINMSSEDLKKEATLTLSVGHLLIVWDILSNKFSAYQSKFTEEEKRAIWALEDLCETALTHNGIKALPEQEWNHLMAEATKLVQTVPVEFLD